MVCSQGSMELRGGVCTGRPRRKETESLNAWLRLPFEEAGERGRASKTQTNGREKRINIGVEINELEQKTCREKSMKTKAGSLRSSIDWQAGSVRNRRGKIPAFQERERGHCCRLYRHYRAHKGTLCAFYARWIGQLRWMANFSKDTNYQRLFKKKWKLWIVL